MSYLSRFLVILILEYLFFIEESYAFFLHVRILAICISSYARAQVSPCLKNFFK